MKHYTTKSEVAEMQIRLWNYRLGLIEEAKKIQKQKWAKNKKHLPNIDQEIQRLTDYSLHLAALKEAMIE